MSSLSAEARARIARANMLRWARYNKPEAAVATTAFDERQAAEDIRHAYDSTSATERDYLTKVIVFGLMLDHTRARLPHGTFQLWLKDHCFPEADEEQFRTARRKLDRWRETARSSCALLQMSPDVALDGRPLHLVLQLPAEHLSDEARKVQSQVLDFLDGKSQHAIQMEFRNLLAQTGGFRPSKTQLNGWLKKHHPDLVGTPFDDLPEKIQKQFRKWLQAEGGTDPKKALAAQYKMAVSAWEDMVRAVRLVTDPDLIAKVQEADRARLAEGLDACTELNHLVRNLKKKGQ